MVKRPSKIDRMPQEVRDWIGRLYAQGRTLDEIIAKLRELDVDALPSRSGLHRHLQKAEEVAKELRRQSAVAEVIVRELGEADSDRQVRLNIDLMHNVIFKLTTRRDEETGELATLTPAEAMMCAKAIDHLGKAAKDQVARTIAVEKRATEKAKADAAKAAEDIGKAKGLSADTVEAIKVRILGITKSAT